MSDKLENYKNIISEHLEEIRTIFSIPIKMTIIIRGEFADNKDIIISNDDLNEVEGAIIRRNGGEIH